MYRWVYQLTGTSHYLLWGRLVTFGFSAATVGLAYLIGYQVSRRRAIAAMGMVLMAFHQLIQETMGYATNNMMAMAFSLLGVSVFLASCSTQGVKPWGVLGSGVAIAIAIGAKLYYAAALPPFLLVASFYPGLGNLSQRFGRIIFPFLAGVMLALLPVGYYFVTDFSLFHFNNLGYHQTNTEWRRLSGHTIAMSLPSKLDYLRWILSFPSSIVLLIGIAASLLALGRKQCHSLESALTLLLVGFTSLAAITPTPLFIHYFAMPASFVILWLTCQLSQGYAMNRVLLILAAMAIALNSPLYFHALQKLPNRDNWRGVAIHQTAQKIRQSLGILNSKDKIATLSPIYALEANFPIYRELATGPFLYRVGDLLSASQRQQMIGTSPETLEQLFQDNPPVGILVGFGRDLDRALIEYAQKHQYCQLPQDFNGATLYVQPSK